MAGKEVIEAISSLKIIASDATISIHEKRKILTERLSGISEKVRTELLLETAAQIEQAAPPLDAVSLHASALTAAALLSSQVNIPQNDAFHKLLLASLNVMQYNASENAEMLAQHGEQGNAFVMLADSLDVANHKQEKPLQVSVRDALVSRLIGQTMSASPDIAQVGFSLKILSVETLRSTVAIKDIINAGSLQFIPQLAEHKPILPAVSMCMADIACRADLCEQLKCEPMLKAIEDFVESTNSEIAYNGHITGAFLVTHAGPWRVNHSAKDRILDRLRHVHRLIDFKIAEYEQLWSVLTMIRLLRPVLDAEVVPAAEVALFSLAKMADAFPNDVPNAIRIIIGMPLLEKVHGYTLSLAAIRLLDGIVVKIQHWLDDNEDLF